MENVGIIAYHGSSPVKGTAKLAIGIMSAPGAAKQDASARLAIPLMN
jgi:hypothetical protein